MTRDAVSKAIERVKAKSDGESIFVEHDVTINFHPDRYTTSNEPLLLAIAQDGYLKSQFETQTSNGGLTAYKGGERWLWEQSIFGSAYDKVDNGFRPKYGALNFRNYDVGAAPRFGSSYFKLKPHTLERTTFCYPDSYFEPQDFAVSDSLESLISKAQSSCTDLLDDYIEAHIHGVISIQDDIESIVLDPIYKGSHIHEQALELGVPLEWHCGFELSVEEMSRYPDYRGQSYVDLAREIAPNGILDVKLLGLAVTELGYEEQDIKKIWHYLARFGQKR
ncbi:DUF3626 domain-containing protein [Vibrio agarivorans]|uniref:DUF3626 domain-containing protein n=1 Tax=Vibrio agarivorans TaxID=153622 RepID=A0ABT7XZM4_9VIBR|nr:DUF3626 domain-containing protein [Vibrio agarivorans]MDN2481237.1 DUF3626 domain-containing protein [Vibrio agarivorans]